MCFDPHTPLMFFPSASVLFPAVSPLTPMDFILENTPTGFE